MGHVAAERIKIGLGKAGGVGLEGQKILLGHLCRSLHHQPVVGQADELLGGVEVPKLLLVLPKSQSALQKVAHTVLYVLADKAVLLTAADGCGYLLWDRLALWEDLALYLGKKALKDKGHGKPAAPGKYLVEVL